MAKNTSREVIFMARYTFREGYLWRGINLGK
jgi:hypothetical protein